VFQFAESVARKPFGEKFPRSRQDFAALQKNLPVKRFLDAKPNASAILRTLSPAARHQTMLLEEISTQPVHGGLERTLRKR
jgi:hypothetical protein